MNALAYNPYLLCENVPNASDLGDECRLPRAGGGVYASFGIRKGAIMSSRSLFLVTLIVDDYDRGKDFYCGVLGFDCVSDAPLPQQRRWLVVRPPGGEGAALLLARAEDEAERKAVGNQTAGRVSFFLKTDDFARDHAAMIAKGICFIEEPRHEAYGTVAVFSDIYGNLWDLIEHAGDAAT